MTYSKASLESITENRFARKSITEVEEEMIVIGKFCRCAYLGGGLWDVWVCNHENLVKGLGTRKLNNIYAGIGALASNTGPLRKLDGEGVYDAMSASALICASRLLGIRSRAKSKGNTSNFRSTAA